MDTQKPKLSCIVLSCDSHIDKGNSVFHCLCSIFNQDFDDFEVILAENSHHKTQDINLLKNKIQEWNSKRKSAVDFNLVDNKKSLATAKARNISAAKAKGEILVFIDDDTIIIDNDAFRKIYNLSKNFDYGYGAERLWTKKSWFEKNFSSILRQLEKKNTRALLANSGNPPKSFREERYPLLQKRTFIANFGFCRKHIFDKMSGFANLPYYRYDDDYLMFRLYEAGYKLVLLDGIRVSHVSHVLCEYQKTNLIPYFLELVKRGYYWFNMNTIFSKKSYKKEEILEKLGTLRYDDGIENLYKEYIKKIPLNLESPFDKASLDSWSRNNFLSKIDIARIISYLQNSKTLDEFIKKSSADFDNLAQVVDLAIKQEFIKVTKSGQIHKSFDFHFTQFEDKKTKKFDLRFTPDSVLNQFPCDSDSRLRRKAFLKSRYPFAEYLKFAIIGDDDFLSSELVSDCWAWPVIVEKDKRILDTIKKLSSRFELIEQDISIFPKLNNLPSVQSFITDPPYTLYGSLAFIYAGLRMLKKDSEAKEFYVVLNPTMIGKNFFFMQKILSESGIFLVETLNNFSQYKLPDNFKERKRANKFLDKIGIKGNSLKYSSSSNLYIFKTVSPNLKNIERKINFNKLYEHYL